MGGEELARLNALQVADAAKFFAGAQVKDYGGIGGLKTISVRSLGANHTAVAYDGVAMTDRQTGQMDLSRLSLDNVARMDLYTGAGDDIFQTARMQSSASALHVSGKRPAVQRGRRISVVPAWRGGSFGLLNPSLSYSQVMDSGFSALFSGEWLQTDGNYPYTSGSGERKRREHSEVENLRLEANLFGDFGKGRALSFKMYGYRTGRSLPGPDIYYAKAPGERVDDRQFFSQAVYRQTLGGKLQYLSVVKFDVSDVHYSSFFIGERKTAYRQWEYYAAGTLLYPVSPALSVSWANDGSYAGFRNDFAVTSPVRTVWQSVLSARYDCPSLTATASLLSFYAHDAVGGKHLSDESSVLSPYLGFSVRMSNRLPLRLRGFYKESFRQPTFADMYAGFVPAQGLRPERTRQLNAGISWAAAFETFLPYASVSVDAYWNRADNKIVAYPTSGMYFWSVQNLGKVDIKGLDVRADTHFRIGKGLSWRMVCAYTRQQAVDRTDTASRSYNRPIKYTPSHTGSVRIEASMPWMEISYTALYCGSRYYEQSNRPEYRMAAYWDHGIALSRRIAWQGVAWTVSASGVNVFDRSYEVIRSYPMPGRSFRFGLQVEY
jgi:hypothetical protein